MARPRKYPEELLDRGVRLVFESGGRSHMWPRTSGSHRRCYASASGRPRLTTIEIYFSILQRKALTPNDFEDLDALAARISAFEEHYRQIAQPFEWTFTRAKLDALLARRAEREPHLRLAA